MMRIPAAFTLFPYTTLFRSPGSSDPADPASFSCTFDRSFSHGLGAEVWPALHELRGRIPYGPADQSDRILSAPLFHFSKIGLDVALPASSLYHRVNVRISFL